MRVLPVLLMLALSGCTGGFLAPPESAYVFTCEVFVPRAGPMEVVVHQEEGATDPVVPGGRLRSELQRVRDNASEAVRLQLRTVDDAPDVWDAQTLKAWAERAMRSRGFGDPPRLHVLWMKEVPGPEPAGMVVVPGVVAVSDNEVARAAQMLGAPRDEVATAVLLHYAGHALGTVNRGVPIQDADLAKREGPPGHDPDPSVMHIGWHEAETAPAVTLAYPDDIVADWQALYAKGACT